MLEASLCRGRMDHGEPSNGFWGAFLKGPDGCFSFFSSVKALKGPYKAL